MGALAVAAAVLLSPAARAEEEPRPGAVSPASDRLAEESPTTTAPANGRLREESSPGTGSAEGPADGRSGEEPSSSAASSAGPPSNRSGALSVTNDHPSASAATADPFPAYRFGYVAGGALALTGTAFGFIAQSEALRAGTLTSARESGATLALARERAATANLCFVLAGATALYALVLEFLPRPAADAASLAFRF